MDMPPRPQRKSPRLKGYDYSLPGVYFVTICTFQREHHFGVIRDETMHLSPIGIIAHEFWQAIPNHFSYIELDAFVVLPNHVHGIVIIKDGYGEYGQQINKGEQKVISDGRWKNEGGRGEDNGGRPIGRPYEAGEAGKAGERRSRPNGPKPRSLSAILGAYKSSVSREVNRQMGLKAPILWQKSFHDHIARNPPSLDAIRAYVIRNPETWRQDKFWSE